MIRNRRIDQLEPLSGGLCLVTPRAQIQIRVIDIHGHGHDLVILCTESVRSLKQRLVRLVNMTPGEQDLYHLKQKLHDQEILLDCGIRSGSELRLSLVRSKLSRNFDSSVPSESSGAKRLKRDVRLEIPQTIELLRDANSSVRSSGATLLTQLFKDGERTDTLSHITVYRDAIKSVMPQILELLKDSDSNVRSSGATLLTQLLKHDALFHLFGYQDDIKSVMPQILELLKDSDSNVRSSGATLLTQLLKHAAFHDTIRPLVPQIQELCKTSHSSIGVLDETILVNFAKDFASLDSDGVEAPIVTTHHDDRGTVIGNINQLHPSGKDLQTTADNIQEMVICGQAEAGVGQDIFGGREGIQDSQMNPNLGLSEEDSQSPDVPPSPLSMEIRFIADWAKEVVDEADELPPSPLSVEVEFIADECKEAVRSRLETPPSPLVMEIQFIADQNKECVQPEADTSPGPPLEMEFESL